MKMEEWKECKLGDVVEIHRGASPRPIQKFIANSGMPWVKISDATASNSRFIDSTKEFIIEDGISKSVIVNPEDLIVSNSATPGLPKIMKIKACIHDGWLYFSNYKKISRDFLYYKFFDIQRHLTNLANGSVFQNLKTDIVKDFTIKLPPLPTQQKIAAILSSLDDKIELNNKINANLEQQAQALFKELFEKQIEKLTVENSKPLGELIDIIDNRGKTPPVSTERNCFPILDVGALNSNGRIIDYKNCTKFVDENTFNTFFRNGHPQKNDILLSTVGSLAQMKFFKGNIGCIAQNVVAFRTKKLSPVYLYEYLKFIRNDLLAYNIGSVQPSIKVTHIIKHLIYIPTDNEIRFFDSFSKSITEQIYNNVCENDLLISIRDTLIPKLMSGEIEVDKLIK